MTWIFPVAALFLVLLTCLLCAIPIVRRHALPVDQHDPAETGLPFDLVHFTTSDKVTLTGWWFPYPDSNRTIIQLHGFAGSMDPDIKYVPHLHAAGYNVLTFDFRAHGRSTGHLGTIGALESNDVKAAIDFVCSKGIKAIGLLGFSMGGRAAVLSAPENPQVRAIVCDGGPARLVTAITGKLTRDNLPYWLASTYAYCAVGGASLLSGINLFSEEPLHRASRLQSIPSLFIYGGRDPFITNREIDRMTTSTGSRATLWLVPEAGHRNIEKYRPQEYLDKVLSFFVNTLETPSEPGSPL